ncbi:hypothetical protein R1sor_000082, partial [Riccia sorocarpa]
GLLRTGFESVVSLVRYDTPLHLVVRTCGASHLLDLMPMFLNHPKFDGAIINSELQTSLELAWIRLAWCGRVPSTFPIRLRVSEGGLRVLRDERNGFDMFSSRDIENFYLGEVIGVLERHPSNAPVLAQREEMRKGAMDSVNAYLVTATLLAGLTFSGSLQPPRSGDDGEQTSKSAQLFWTFNSLSFFFAVQCILTSLYQCIYSDEKLYLYGNSLYLAMVRIQGAVPLTLSVGFGILAFVVAGFTNVPSDSKALITACAI